MKRLTMLAAAAFIVVGTVGCQHNRCHQCEPRGGGLLGGLGAGLRAHHDGCNVATGCRACKLGWQHGGLDYSEGLATGHPLHGHPGHHSARYGRGAEFGPAGAAAQYGGGGQYGPAGPPTAAVAYPYYTVRGPRDFLRDDPPSIGN